MLARHQLIELHMRYNPSVRKQLSLLSCVNLLQTVDEEATAKKRQEAIDAAKAKGEDADQVTVDPVKKSNKTTEWDWAVQNSNKPIWTRSPKEVKLPTFLNFLIDLEATSHYE